MITLSVKIKMALALSIVLIAYTPIKDAIGLGASFFVSPSVDLIDISFGNASPWSNKDPNHLVKVAHTANPNKPSFSGPQIIYTRFKLANPSNEVVTFKNIWLTFKYKNGVTDYTTDHNLYNSHTRQKLIGNKIQLAPGAEIELLASYRFIPSYSNSEPAVAQVSWEGQKQLRDSSCELNFQKLTQNNFGNMCN